MLKFDNLIKSHYLLCYEKKKGKNMAQYDDIISSNIESIKNELINLNSNLNVLTLILLADNKRLNNNNTDTIAKLRNKYQDIIQLLKQ